MSKWSTTPVLSKVRTTRVMLMVIAVIVAVATPLSVATRAYADKYDDQMRSLQQAASQYQSQASELRAKGDTLQNKLSEITAQKGALETQITINQAKHDKLIEDIAANQKKIEASQVALGKTLASLYVDGQISTIEMLASSENVGDYVDKQEYRSSVRDQLKRSIDTIKALKKQMETDKTAVEKTLKEMDAQRAQLAALQAEQQRLVDQTRGEEAAYQNLVNNAKSQLADVAAQQRAYYQSLISRGGGGSGVVGSFKYSNWSGNKGCSGGYPFCAGGLDYGVNQKYGLYYRECVDYVAWALESRFGKKVNHFAGQGNAAQWIYSAPANSGASRVSTPQRGDAVILPVSGSFAPVGHAMIVESVSGDTMHVSQYNFYGTGEYSTMDVKNSGVVLLRFQDK